jgi:hypothetical protein
MLRPALTRFAAATGSAAEAAPVDSLRPASSEARGRRTGLEGYLATAAVAAALLWGWNERDQEFITPDNGLGYWLGIVGSTMMVLLLYYSFRKRQRHGHGFLSIPTWFRIHMVLGVVGPLLVVFHTNFHMQAVNSSVALICMLTVAGSGVVGRYLYKQIHDGLSDNKARAQSIATSLSELRRDYGAHGELAEPLFDELDNFGGTLIERNEDNALVSFVVGGKHAFRAAWMRSYLPGRIRAVIDARGATEGWTASERKKRNGELSAVVGAYFDATLTTARYRFFERLFSLWHMVHLPLYIIMVLTALIHIWAVHRF